MLFEQLEDRRLLAVLSDGGTSTLNISLAANENLAIVSNGLTYTFSTNQTFTNGGVTNSADYSAFGSTSITLQAAGISRYSTLINITDTNGSKANTTVTFNNSGANSYANNLSVALTNAAAGIITFNGNSSFSGTSALNASTEANIVVSFGAAVTTTNGNLMLSAGLHLFPTSADFTGINVSGTVQATGSGVVTVQGTGASTGSEQFGVQVSGKISGGSSGKLVVQGVGAPGNVGGNYGVFVTGATAKITSSGGDVQVIGQGGGGSGAFPTSSFGVYVLGGAQVTAGGSGNVVVQGTGGLDQSSNVGVTVSGTGSAITSSGGNVQVTGQGSVGTSDGVDIQAGGLISAGGSGKVTVQGFGASGSGNSGGPGVHVLGSGSKISSGGGNVLVTGQSSNGGAIFLENLATITTATNGGNVTLIGDTINIQGTLKSKSNGTVTLQPYTSDVQIDLGGAGPITPFTFTNADLANITTGSLIIGSSSAGHIGVSAAITGTSGWNSLTLITSANVDQSIPFGTALTLSNLNVTAPTGIFLSFSALNSLTTDSSGFNGEQFLQGSGVATISSLNAGTGLIHFNGGAFNLSGANQINTNTALEIDNGTFGIGANNQTVSQLILISGNVTGSTGVLTSTTAIDARSASVSAILGGTNGLTKTTAGFVNLSSANMYSGVTTISGGILLISADNNLGVIPSSPTPGSLVINGGTLEATASFTLNSNRGIALGSTGSGGVGSIDVTSGNTLNYGGVIGENGGTGGLTKFDSGTLLLSGANTYHGSTTIVGGILSISADNNLGTAPGNATAGKIVIINSATLQATSSFVLNSNRGITLGSTSGGGIGMLDVTNNNILTYGGIIANTGSGTGGLTKTNSGTLILAGNNTYKGVTAINGGTLSINADNRLGAAPSSATPGKLVINGGTLQATASFTLNTNRGVALGPTSGGGIGTFDVTNGNTLIYGGIIANNGGTGGLVKTNSGTLTLSGLNTYKGATTISGGTLSISADNNLGAAPASAAPGSVVINGGTLQATFSFALSSNRGIALGPTSGSGVGTMDVTGSNTITYGGIIADNGGTGGLTKSNSGTLIPSGANTYSGGTTISGGTLSISTDGNLGAIPSSAVTNITIGAATLQSTTNDVALNANRNISLTGPATLNSSMPGMTLTVGGTVNGAQALTLSGPGNVTFANTIGDSAAPTGITQQGTAGTASFNAGATFGSGGATFNANVVLGQANSTFSSSGPITFGTNASNTLSVNGTGVETITTAAANAGVTLNAITTASQSVVVNLGTGTFQQNAGATLSLGGNSLTIDSATPSPTSSGAGTININANINATGAGTISLKASQNIAINGAATTVSTVNGDLTLLANQQVISTTGTFVGVLVAGIAQATGIGQVSIRGIGGTTGIFNDGVSVTGMISGGTIGTTIVSGNGGSSTTANHSNRGIVISGPGLITSSGSDVQVAGVGNATGGSQQTDYGVHIANGGQVTAGGTGNVTVQGTGISGVYAYGGGIAISSSGGNVQVTGQATGISNQYLTGVYVDGGAIITAGGTGDVTVFGTGATTGTSGCVGVGVLDPTAMITSSGGNVTVTGIGEGMVGGIQNYGVLLFNSGEISAGGTGIVTVHGTAGQGSTSDGVNLWIGTITSGGGNVVVIGDEGPGSSIGIRQIGGAVGPITTATNGGNVTLIANSMSLNNEISTKSNGSVTLAPYTTGVGIKLLGSGTNPVGGPLSLLVLELNRIITGSLIIGSTSAGNIDVSFPIAAPAGWNSLNLITGANVTQTASGTGLTLSNLTITAPTGIGTVSKPLVFSALSLLTTDTSGSNSNQFLKSSGTASVTSLTAGTGTIDLTGGTFNLSGSNQINANTMLQLDGGTFGIGANNQTVAQLIINGGTASGSTGVLTSNAVIDGRRGSASAILAGTSGLTKTTTGTLTLSGANIYSGPTNVNNGPLLINGSITNDAVINSGGILGGAGSIGGNLLVSSGGTVDPGNGPNNPGMLTAGSANFALGGNFNAEVFGNGPAAATNGYDQLVLTAPSAALTLGGTSKFTVDVRNLKIGGNLTAPGMIRTSVASDLNSGFATIDTTTRNRNNVPAAVTYSPPAGSVSPLNANSVDLALSSNLSNVALTTPTSINEGDVATLTGTVQPAGAADTMKLVVDWGDNFASPATLNFLGTQTSFTVTHQYLDNIPKGLQSTFGINLTLTNTSVPSDIATATTGPVTLNNLPPTVSGPSFIQALINEDELATLTGTLSDPGPLDTFSLVVNWADGSALQTFSNLPSGSFTAKHLFLNNGPPGATSTFTASFTAMDDDGSTSLTVTVVEMVKSLGTLNTAALTDAGFVVASINENDVATLTANLSDTAPQDTFTLAINWSDGTPTQTFNNLPSGAFTATHRYLDNIPKGPASTFVANLALTDSTGVSAPAATVAITLNNLPPTLIGVGFFPATINENDVATLTATLTDPGTSDTFSLVVDWTDGSAAQTFTNLPSGSFTATHRYLDNFPRGQISNTMVTLIATDDDGGASTTVTAVETVNDLPPTIAGAGFVAAKINENELATLTATLSDPSSLDTFSLVVDWADGSAPQSFINLAAGLFAATHLYLDNFPHGQVSTLSVNLTLTDDDGGAAPTSIVAVQVNNLPPTLTGAGFASTTVNENGVATLTATLSDPGPLDTFTLVVNWADGSSPQTFSNLSAGSFTATHRYLDNVPQGHASTFSVVLALTDDDGAAAPVSTVAVQVNNLPPTLSNIGFASATINENDIATLTATFSDPGTLDTFSLLIDWADGSGLQTFTNLPSGSFSATHRYLGTFFNSQSSTFTVNLVLTDDDGDAAPLSTLAVQVNNLPPTLASVGFISATINENDVAILTAVLSDPGPLDTFTLVIDWADGTTPQTFTNLPSGSFSATHQYLDNFPAGQTSTFSTNLVLSDEDGASAPAVIAILSLKNLPPTLSNAGFVLVTLNEDDVVTLTATLSDPGLLDTFTLVINWADGSAPQTFSNLPSGSFTATHRYLDNAPSGPASTFLVDLAVTDDDGASAPVITAALTLNNLPPTLTGAGFASTTVNENGVATLTATLSDPGPLDTFTLVVNWADGSISQTFGNLPSGLFTATHHYTGATSGQLTTFLVNLALSDDDGATAPPSTVALQVNNSPPTLTGVGFTSASIDENSVATLTGTLSGSGSLETFTLVVNWADGSASQTFSNLPSGAFTATHRYLDNVPPGPTSTFSVNLALTDSDGGGASVLTVTIQLNDLPPTLTDAGFFSVTINENDVATLTGMLSDPGTLDTFSLVVDWADGRIPQTFTNLSGGSFSATHRYLDNLPPGQISTFSANLALSDDDGGGAPLSTVAIQVHNLPPILMNGGFVSIRINENDVATWTATLSDPGTLDTFSLVVDWADGSNPQTFTNLSSGSFSATHRYLDNLPKGATSTLLINVALSDDDGASAVATTSALTLNNLPPTLSGAGFVAAAINENGTATLTATLSDPGTLDTFTLVVNWADGSNPQTFTNLSAGSFSATHKYLDNLPKGVTSTFQVKLALSDDDGTAAVATTAALTLNNLPPTLSGAGFVVATINENGIATLTATLSDPGTLDTFTLVVNWADGSALQSFNNLPSGSFSATHRYLDNVPSGTNSTMSVRLSLSDDDGTSAPAATVTVVVHDLPPTLSGATFVLATINENDVATLTGVLSDPGSRDTFTLVVNWADGGAPQTFSALPSGVFSATHRYLDNVPKGAVSNFSVGLTLRDDDGIAAPSATAILKLKNVAPATTATGGTTSVGSPFTLTGSFTDPGTLDTFSFLWHLVTASNHQALADVATQNLTFTPASAGTYTFSFRVTDDDGGVGSNTVVVIASAAGPATAKFDFEAAGGLTTTAPGYKSVLGGTTYTAALGYGWLTAATSFDRGGTNSLLRDGNYGGASTAGARTFQAKVANGSYLVNVTMGDASFARDLMQVKNADNGAVLLSNITVAAGQFYQAEVPVTVTDGSLDLQFSDQGGDPFWVVNALEIRPAASVIPVSFTSGPGNVSADGLSTDTINGTAAVPNGTILTVSSSLGTIITDSNGVYAGSQVVVSGGTFSFQISRPMTAGTPTFVAAAIDGSARGTTSNPAVLSYQAATTRRFDFNGPDDVTAAGFIGVRGNTLYSASTGFGWVTTVGEFDRGTASPTTTALYRDGNYGPYGASGAGMFELQVTPSGTYGIRAYIGDASYARDNIEVSVEGGDSATVAYVDVNQFTTVTLTGVDTNHDGILTVTIQDLGGDPYWVINGLDISASGVVNLPSGATLQAVGNSSGANASATLTSQALVPIVQEAIARWQAAGIGSQAVAMLQGVKFQITNLDSSGDLGLATPGLVQIDDNGDGYGWFVDPTSKTDVEFATKVATTELKAIAGSHAFSHMDLLTVVMHELGHELGLVDLSVSSAAHALMAESITTGLRRLPPAMPPAMVTSMKVNTPLPLIVGTNVPTDSSSVVSDVLFASLGSFSGSSTPNNDSGAATLLSSVSITAIPLSVESNLSVLQPSLVKKANASQTLGSVPRKLANSVDAVFNLLGR